MLETGQVLHASLACCIGLVCHDASDCFREPLSLGLCPWALSPSTQQGCAILGQQLHALNSLDHGQDLAFSDGVIVGSGLHSRQEACHCLQVSDHLVGQGGSRHGGRVRLDDTCYKGAGAGCNRIYLFLAHADMHMCNMWLSSTACEHCPARRCRRLVQSMLVMHICIILFISSSCHMLFAAQTKSASRRLHKHQTHHAFEQHRQQDHHRCKFTNTILQPHLNKTCVPGTCCCPGMYMLHA